ncbi:MAG: nuclear transport factor 2 family protein [Parcubacteria group bacterium]|nr:nuclear transport factor 2 family protein [Parcubacteria group bacterium]
MPNQTLEKHNIDTVLATLKDEVEGNVKRVFEKLHKDYSMTWVYKRRDGVLFPSIFASQLEKELPKVYAIKGREYAIKNIIAQGNVVMAELVESYPAPDKPNVHYRTPMVIVWEFEDGKIKTGRHYCDPQLSFENLSKEQIESIYK